MAEEEETTGTPEDESSNLDENQPNAEESRLIVHEVRCPSCDFRLSEKVDRCLMCGEALDPIIFLTEEERLEAEKLAEEEKALAEAELAPEEAAAKPKKARSMPRMAKMPGLNWRPTPLFGISLVFFLFTAVVGTFGFYNPNAIPISLLPSLTPTQAPLVVPPTQTPTLVPTATPLVTDTPSPTVEPTVTPTPLPTNTPEPLRSYTVLSGQTLVGIASLFGYTLESFFEANNFNEQSIIIEGQEILVPWPSATPPLQPIFYDIGGQTLIIDPSNCPPFYEIQEGDSLFSLASRNDIPLDALLEMNYLTVDSIVQPGDPLCIPQILEGAVFIPTPGPSPTPAPTEPPTGPNPLYPPNLQAHGAGETVFLQWLSVRQLGENEQYMVEVIDLTDVDSHPRRLFTRSAGVSLPDSWEPVDGEHDFVWRVSLVTIDGRRDNGGYIYTIIGAESVARQFSWGN